MIGQSKTRLLGVTVLIAVFAAGGLTGAVVQRSAFADNTQPTVGQPKRGPSLFETLKLTAEQQAKVCTMMKANRERAKPDLTAMESHMSAIDSLRKDIRVIFEATSAQMDSVLTPDQLATKDRYRAERVKFFQQRDSAMKAQRQKDSTEPHRGGSRPGPGNPLGISCPGLDDRDMGGHRGPGSGGGYGPQRDSAPAKAPTTPTVAKPEHQA